MHQGQAGAPSAATTTTEDESVTERGSGSPLMTVAEVAAALRVSNMTVYRLIKAGDLPALRVGKNYRIQADDLDAFLAGGGSTADRANG